MQRRTTLQSVSSKMGSILTASRDSEVFRHLERMSSKKSKDNFFAWFDFFVVYTACFLTPISIMVQQTFDVKSFVTWCLLLCDFRFFLHCCRKMISSKPKSKAEMIMLVFSFPMVFAWPIVSQFHDSGTPNYWMWFSVTRMGKLMVLKARYREFSGFLEQSSALFNDMVSRMMRTVLYFFLYANCLACVWFYISCRDRSVCRSELQLESYGGQYSSIHNTWILEDSYIDTNSVASCYFRSLHFVMVSLLTVGYGDIFPINTYEICFTIYLMINGVLFYGFLISSITSILASKDFTTKTYRNMLTGLKEYFRLRSANKSDSSAVDKLRDFFVNYYEHLYTKQFGMLESEIFRDLPVSIVRDLKQTHFEALKKCSFFSAQNNLFVEMCLDKMAYVTYGPESAIENSNDELKLVVMGKVNLMTKDGSHNVHTYLSGECIGEFGFIFCRRQEENHNESVKVGMETDKALEVSYDLVSNGFTTLLVLDHSAFCEVVHEFSLLSLEHATSDASILSRHVKDEFSQKAAQYLEQLNEKTMEASEVEEAESSAALAVGPETNEERRNSIPVAFMPVNDEGERSVNTAAAMAAAAAAAVTAKQREGANSPTRGTLVKRGSVNNFHHRSILHTVLCGSPGGVIAGGALSHSATPVGGSVANSHAGSHVGSRAASRAASHADLLSDYVDPFVLNLLEGLERVNKSYREFADKVTHCANAQMTRRRGLIKFGLMEEMAVDTKHTIAPSSVKVLIWNVLMFWAVIYYAMAIPLRIMLSYSCGHGNTSTTSVCLSRWYYSLIVDYLCDVLFALDFVLRARFFAYRTFTGDVETIVMDPELIFKRFKYTLTFYIDLLMMFPIDLLSLGTGYLLCYRLVKLLSLLLLPKLLSHIQSFLDRELNFNINAEAMTVLNLAIATILLAIWIGVGFELIKFHGDATDFMTSYDWTFTTMTTTGYGDITPVTLSQTVYTVFVCFLAPTIFATILAKFASYVKVSNISPDNVEHRLITVQQYLKTTLGEELESDMTVAKEDDRRMSVMGGRLRRSLDKMPSFKIPRNGMSDVMKRLPSKLPSMRFNISQRYMTVNEAPLKRQTVASVLEVLANEYYEHISADEVAGLNETRLKQGVPSYLMHKLRFMVVEDLIENASVFCNFDEEFRREIMLSTEQLFFCKKHVIVKKTITSDGMYFIKSGTVKFRLSSDEHYRVKGPGECVAEFALVAEVNNIPQFEIIAITDCELWYLSRSAFHHALHKFPANHAHMPDTKQKVEGLMEQHRTSFVLQDVLRLKKNHDAAKKSQKCTLSPTSTTMYLWTCLIVLVTLYNLFMIPLRIAFYQGVSLSYPLYIDYIGDLIYVLDMLIRGSLLAYKEQDDLIRAPKKIFLHYLSSVEFRYHFAALIPTDLFAYAGRIGTMGTMQTIALLRVNKLLRLHDTHQDCITLQHSFVTMLKKVFKVKVDASMLRIVNLIMGLIVAAYVFGCVFFIIANQSHLAHNYNNWADVHHLFDATEDVVGVVANQCIHSIYWAMQVLTTTGYGDIVPANDNERLYNILLFVCGTFLFASIIVHLQDIVSQLDVTSDLYKRRVARIHDFLIREEVSRDFSEKVKKYYSVLWSQQRGADCTEILEFLPSRLYTASIVNVAKKPVADLFFVNKCTAVFQNAFIAKLQIRQYITDDNLFRDGERATRLFLIHSGEVSLVGFDDASADSNTRRSFETGPRRKTRSNKSKQARTLYLNVREGFVGESEFFSRSCYACSGKATTDSMILEIDFDTFWELIVEQRLVNNFIKTVGRDCMRLHRNSTLTWVKKMNDNMKNAKLNKMMSTARIIKANDGTLLPDSLIVEVWNCVCLLLLLVMAVMVPYFIAFDQSLYVFQLAVDTLFVFTGALDILGNLYYFAIEVEGNMVTDPVVFRPLYVKKYLLQDVLGTLPVSLLYFAGTHNYAVYRWLRLLYLFRMQNLQNLLMKCYRAFELNTRIKIRMAKLRVVFTLIVFLYVVHIVACIFALIGKSELQKGEKNWIEFNGFVDVDHFVYLRAFYWALYSSTTIGYGSVGLTSHAEMLFAALTMILGSVMTATLSAMLSAIIESADSTMTSLRRSQESAIKFCQTHQVKPELRAKINEYFKYLNESLITSGESDDLQLLSTPLKAEYVLNKIWKEAKKISFLDAKLFDKSAQYGFISSMVHYVEVYLSVPNEVLVQIPLQHLQQVKKRGKAYKYLSRDLFFLRRGSVYATVRDPEHTTNPTTGAAAADSHKNYFSADQVIELSGIVTDAQVATAVRTRSETVLTDTEPKYDYSVKLMKMSINVNDDNENGVIQIATTNVSLSKQPVGSRVSSSVAFSNRKGMFTAAFEGEQQKEKLASFNAEDSVLFFDVCIGHTHAKEFTYHVGGAVFQIADLLKKIDARIANDDNASDSSSGDEYIKEPHRPSVVARDKIKLPPLTGTVVPLDHPLPESVPLKSFSSFSPFKLTHNGSGSGRHSNNSAKVVPLLQPQGRSSMSELEATAKLSPSVKPFAGRASVSGTENAPVVIEHPSSFAEGANESDSEDDDEDEESDSERIKSPRVAGTYVERVSALIVDETNDHIIGSVTIEVTAVRVGGPEVKPDAPKSPKKPNNLLGVGGDEDNKRKRTSVSGGEDAEDGDSQKPPPPIGVVQRRTSEVGMLQRRMSEVLRDSVKNIAPLRDSLKNMPGLQRRMSNLQLVLSGDEPESINERCSVPYNMMESHSAMAVAVSEGYAHLFRVPVSRLQEVESYFLMSRETVNHRVNLLPKKLGQKSL